MSHMPALAHEKTADVDGRVRGKLRGCLTDTRPYQSVSVGEGTGRVG